MRTIYRTILVLLLLGATGLAAQDASELFEIPLSRPSAPGQLVLQQIEGSIRVSGYSGKTVKVKATFKGSGDEKEPEEMENGMKRIRTVSGKVTGEESDNTVFIRNKGWNRIVDFDIQVPENFSLKLKTVNNGEITVNGLNGTFEISNVNGSIRLSAIAGAVTADSINGDIVVFFREVDPAASMAFSSLNGDLDVRFPEDLKASIKARSDWGDVFTDFDLNLEKEQSAVKRKQDGGTYKLEIEDWVKGTVGGGGPQLLFKTYNGDVFIRNLKR